MPYGYLAARQRGSKLLGHRQGLTVFYKGQLLDQGLSADGAVGRDSGLGKGGGGRDFWGHMRHRDRREPTTGRILPGRAGMGMGPQDLCSLLLGTVCSSLHGTFWS